MQRGDSRSLAIFQSNGKYPVTIEQLNILVIELIITGAANLRIRAGILSTPVALGAVHMSRASPANRADLSHENRYFSTT